MSTFDSVLAMRMFNERVAANRGVVKVDNSRLPAGSPMHYYCRFCGDRTAVLPEGHLEAAPRVCHPCKVLWDHGLIK